MTQSAYANATINNMLGWLKGFATWVLRMFNLAGRGGFSPLSWLAENWLQLLITLLITGIVVDIVVWLIRWRPYWVWFRKKRILIEDENFFASEDSDEVEEDDMFDRELFGSDDDEPEAEEKRPRRRRPARSDEGAAEFVVASTVVQRGGSRTHDHSGAGGDHYDRYRRPSTIVTRDPEIAGQRESSEPENDIFGTSFDGRTPAPPQWDEDDVFNVSDLPISEQPEDFEPRPAKRRRASAHNAQH